MTQLDWRRELRDATRTPPRGAKERVWQRLEGGRAPRAWWPALALAGAAAVALAVLLWPRTESTVLRSDDYAVAVDSARYEWNEATRTLSLERGAVTASAWKGAPLRILARGRVIAVEAAVVDVAVAGDDVTITPVQGAVLVDSQRVVATQPLAGAQAQRAQALTPLEPPDVDTQRASTTADRALERQDYDEAVRALDVVGHSGRLGAEAALFRKGEVELRQLKTPDRALATFDDGDALFPAGSLSHERGLSALEALAGLHRWDDVEARAARFLADFPQSERLQDVRRLHVQALFELGRGAEACREVRGLTGDSAETLRARCSL